MEAKEFLQAALAAGAQVEFVDGKMVVIARDAALVPPQRKRSKPTKPNQKEMPPTERTSGKNYVLIKERLGEAHSIVMNSAIGVLMGARHGQWTSCPEETLEYSVNVDIPTLRECAGAAIGTQHAIGRGRKTSISLSTAALCAAMYAAIDSRPSFTMSEACKVLDGTAFKRVALDLSRRKAELGGARSAAFRRESYNQFMSVMLGTEE